MNAKQLRQRKILDLIAEGPIATQEDLANALRQAGVETAQSTLSKDIRELRVVKLPFDGGGFRYVRAVGDPSPDAAPGFLRRVLTDFVVGWDRAENILVVRTIAGHAQGVCEAIDQEEWPEVVGTIAGENTIFVLCRSARSVKSVWGRIESLSGGRQPREDSLA